MLDPALGASGSKPANVAQLNSWSLLLQWPGTDAALRPAVFISHLDVVPVGEESAWKYAPFSGTVAEGDAQPTHCATKQVPRSCIISLQQ